MALLSWWLRIRKDLFLQVTIKQVFKHSALSLVLSSRLYILCLDCTHSFKFDINWNMEFFKQTWLKFSQQICFSELSAFFKNCKNDLYFWASLYGLMDVNLIPSSSIFCSFSGMNHLFFQIKHIPLNIIHIPRFCPSENNEITKYDFVQMKILPLFVDTWKFLRKMLASWNPENDVISLTNLFTSKSLIEIICQLEKRSMTKVPQGFIPSEKWDGLDFKRSGKTYYDSLRCPSRPRIQTKRKVYLKILAQKKIWKKNNINTKTWLKVFRTKT